jgi:hypothetical protein
MDKTAQQRLAAFGPNIGGHIERTPAQQEYHDWEVKLGHRREAKPNFVKRLIVCSECNQPGGTLLKRLDPKGGYAYVHYGTCEEVRAVSFFRQLFAAGKKAGLLNTKKLKALAQRFAK